MKILHIVASMNPENGGVSKAVQVIVDGLKAHKVESEVVSLDHPEASFLKDWSFDVCGVGPGKSPWQYSNKLVPWLDDHFADFSSIIIHGLWLYSSYATEKALRRYKRKQLSATESSKIPKLFVMPHGMLDPYFQQASGRKLKAYRNWAYFKLFEQHVVNNADGLLFTCEEEKQLAAQSFRPYSPKLETVVGLGMPQPPSTTPSMLTAFEEKCPEIKDCSYLLFLSRIHAKKGVDVLVKAYTHIQEKLLKEAIEMPKLVIAGPGLATLYGKEVQQLASATPQLRDSIFFPGMLSGDSKWGAFYNATAFVLPSHQENFGFAVVEALACSTPVLISDQVNIWREIETAKGGLIAPDTLEGTQKNLEFWIRLSPEAKRTMSERAFQTYKQNFEINKASENLAEAMK